MALKKRNKVSAEFSMSSLTDIIFLLLIFFMLTSQAVTQNALNLTLPSSSSKTIAPEGLAVSIEKGGKFTVAGKKVRKSAVKGTITKWVNSRKKREKATVTIMAETGSEIEHTVFVMDIANKLKISAILATSPE